MPERFGWVRASSGVSLPAFYHVGHQAVVARKLLEPSLVQQICARISHLSDDQAVFLENGGGHGGAHASTSALFVRGQDDGAVCVLDGASERGGVGGVGRFFSQDGDGYL